jgi:hypothetical protein
MLEVMHMGSNYKTIIVGVQKSREPDRHGDEILYGGA